jgi:hypothetical protein
MSLCVFVWGEGRVKITQWMSYVAYPPSEWLNFLVVDPVSWCFSELTTVSGWEFLSGWSSDLVFFRVDDCVRLKDFWVDDCVRLKDFWVDDCVRLKDSWVDDCVRLKDSTNKTCGWVLIDDGRTGSGKRPCCAVTCASPHLSRRNYENN